MNKHKKILVGLLLLVVVFCVIFFPIYYRKKHHTKEHFESIWNEYEFIFIPLIIAAALLFLGFVFIKAKRNNYLPVSLDNFDRFATQ